MKDTSISIRMDSVLKEQAEAVVAQFGLNMTSVVNMLFHQIVREQAIPLSLSLKPRDYAMQDIMLAKTERTTGYAGRTADTVADDMERIISEVEHGKSNV